MEWLTYQHPIIPAPSRSRGKAVLRRLYYIQSNVNWGTFSDRLQLTGKSLKSMGRFGFGLEHDFGHGHNSIRLNGGVAFAWFKDVIQTQDTSLTNITQALGLSAGLEYRGIRLEWTQFLKEEYGNMISFALCWPGVLAVF